MKWDEAADAAIRRIPVSERRKVKARAEAAVLKAGRDIVELPDVEGIGHVSVESDTHVSAGYRFDVCGGKGACPNRAHGQANDDSMQLAGHIRALLEEENLGAFLKQQVTGPLRSHHAFRVSLSDCPNACSQPQIKDIGIVAAAVPVLTENACIICGACEHACRESAVYVDTDRETPVIDPKRCISCGSCIAVCPTGKIEAGKIGYRVMIGGKLGRHPRLADELPGIHDTETVLFIVKWCVDEYRKKSRLGRRFAEIVAKDGGALAAGLKAAIDNRFHRKKGGNDDDSR